MKNYKKEITISILLTVLFGGVIYWFAKHEPERTLKIILISLLLLIGLVSFILQFIKRRTDIKNNVPTEDEFTNKAKLYAESKAFLYSFYLWFLIFIFNTSFSDAEEMLGVGMLGSAAIYGLLYLYYKSTSDFLNEK